MGRRGVHGDKSMMTYYGVWSGEEWWYINGRQLFCTVALGVAKAQAMVANSLWRAAGREGHWEARMIGEDGLPAPIKTQGEALLVDPLTNEVMVLDKVSILADLLTNRPEARGDSPAETLGNFERELDSKND